MLLPWRQYGRQFGARIAGVTLAFGARRRNIVDMGRGMVKSKVD
jgi:hypothetical protein